jgi:hypothetical protein
MEPASLARLEAEAWLNQDIINNGIEIASRRKPDDIVIVETGFSGRFAGKSSDKYVSTLNELKDRLPKKRYFAVC